MTLELVSPAQQHHQHSHNTYTQNQKLAVVYICSCEHIAVYANNTTPMHTHTTSWYPCWKPDPRLHLRLRLVDPRRIVRKIGSGGCWGFGWRWRWRWRWAVDSCHVRGGRACHVGKMIVLC